MKYSIFLSLTLSLAPLMARADSVKDPRYFLHDNTERVYYLNIPKHLPKNAPLIVALHGLGGQAHRMRYGLGLHHLAGEMGFAALFPQGGTFGDNTTYWNAEQGLGDHDDLGFLTRLIDHVTQENRLNAARVYVLGISNGAQMAYHLACHIPERIAGIAAVSGTMTSRDWSDCHLQKPVSLLHIHGAEDLTVAFEGGVSWHSTRETYPAAPALVAQWATDAGAGLDHAPKPPTPDVSITHYETPDGVPIELHRLEHFGHDWPTPENAGFSAAQLIASFFMDNPG